MPDVVLRMLVGLVNDSDLEMGVTLHVSGVIVSGVLISYKSYWEEFRVLVRENGSPESRVAREAFADTFTAAITGASLGPSGVEPGVEGEEAAPPAPPNHLHLRDATVWAPGVEPTLAKTLWRGRLSHVSAWSIGTFGN